MTENPFIIPPEEGGQIVTRSYAMMYERNGQPIVIRLTYDSADGSRSFDAARPLPRDSGEYWNGGPKNKRWRSVSPDYINDLMVENGYEPFSED